jgi:CopG family nickel-responsive transcriptional regulator
MAELERVSVTMEKDLIERFDRLLAHHGQANRSEALRDLVRSRLIEEQLGAGHAEAVGTITLIYDHERRRLADRLLASGHEHHGLVIASLHVHLDATNCLEVIAVRGKPAAIRHFANHTIGMKGVKHGKLTLSSTDV